MTRSTEKVFQAERSAKDLRQEYSWHIAGDQCSWSRLNEGPELGGGCLGLYKDFYSE